MKQGTRRYCSAAEKDQAQRYIEFLQTVQHITNQKSLDAYKGAVTARGKLTEAARAAGLLKNGVESLLTMTDPAQVRAVRDWWVREGRSSYSGPQAHMGHWLAFQGAPPENRKIPERVLPQRLRVPSHGVRLRFLLQAFLPITRSPVWKRAWTSMQGCWPLWLGRRDGSFARPTA